MMSKPIVLTQDKWYKLKNRLTNDYSPSVMMLSYKTKDKLGFTVREHREWTEQRGYMVDIRLDFYNEPKRTMFLLKYSEYLEKDGKTSLDII
jgi:hypothetical protein